MHNRNCLCKIAKLLCIFHMIFIKSSFLDYGGLRFHLQVSISFLTGRILGATWPRLSMFLYACNSLVYKSTVLHSTVEHL